MSSEERIQQLKHENKFNEALVLIEEDLIKNTQKYGKQSQQFNTSSNQLCQVCNLLAIQCFEKNSFDEGLSYLLKAESIFSNYKEQLNICLCNLGCYYTLLQNYEISLSYFDKALKLSIELSNKKISAEIYLNISTVLNKIGQYKQSAEHCLNSIILIQELLTDPSESPSEEEFITISNILILAYRNLAVQFDNLNDLSTALLYYEISRCLNDQLKQIPNYETFLIQNSASKNNIIDNVYKLELIKTLKSNSSVLLASFQKIGNKGKEFYNEFLEEILNILQEKVNLEKIINLDVKDQLQESFAKIVEEKESVMDKKTENLAPLNKLDISNINDDDKNQESS